MTVLFDRRATLTVDTIQTKMPGGLRFSFSVERSLTKPNKASFVLYNLTDQHAAQLEEYDSVPVQLDAGYKDAEQTIFLGQLRGAGSYREGPDIKTELRSTDGSDAHRKARVNKTIAKTATTESVLRDMATALGVGEGNLSKAVATFKTTLSSGNVFSRGTILSGSASREMTRVCRSLDLEWSIQNGQLQILPRGQALAGTAVVVDLDHGMIGRPTVDGKGVVSFTSLLSPELFPGRLAVIKGQRLTAQIRIEETTYSGDTHADTWKVEVKGRRY